MNDHGQAKEVICQIVAAAGGRLEGKLRLYKAFYFAHLYYWRNGRGVLTDHPIVRMPMGPGIDDASTILRELQQEGKLRVTTRLNGPFQEYVYHLASPSAIDPNDPRYQAVEQAVEWVRDKGAAELSQETHLYSRSWRDARDGEVLDIYSDLLEDEEHQAVVKRIAEAEELIDGIFARTG